MRSVVIGLGRPSPALVAGLHTLGCVQVQVGVSSRPSQLFSNAELTAGEEVMLPLLSHLCPFGCSPPELPPSVAVGQHHVGT